MRSHLWLLALACSCGDPGTGGDVLKSEAPDPGCVAIDAPPRAFLVDPDATAPAARTTKIDVDGDGPDDVVFTTDAFCSSLWCYANVYRVDGTCARLLGTVAGDLTISTSKSGVVDLISQQVNYCSRTPSGDLYTRYTYDGAHYVGVARRACVDFEGLGHTPARADVTISPRRAGEEPDEEICSPWTAMSPIETPTSGWPRPPECDRPELLVR